MTFAIELAGPCLVVGGGGGGIGSAVAIAAAQAGASVGVITHNREHVDEMLGELGALGAPAAAAVADVLDEEALVEAIASVRESLGTIRYLVNVVGGAGSGAMERAADFQLSTLEWLLSKNLRYALVACREVAGPLIEAGASGSIVNTSSGAASGIALLGSYSAAKAGLEAYSRTMALEWGHRGIRVNVVSCGIIRTRRNADRDTARAEQGIPLRRRGESEEAAAASIFLLSDRSGYTTGHVLDVDGGQHLGSAGGDDLPVPGAQR